MKPLICLALTVALMIGSVGAAGEPFALIGLGLASCGTWTAARRDRRSSNYAQWILGFLSGAADVGVSNGMNLDPLKGVDADGVLGWMDNYCQAHPLSQIVDAAESFSHVHPHP